MVEMTADNKRIFLTIMVYNDQVEVLRGGGGSVGDLVKRVRAGGSTNFVAVFHKIKEIMQVCGSYCAI